MVATAQALAVHRTTRVRRCLPSDSLSIVSLRHGERLRTLECRPNTGDKLRSSIACAGFVCCIPLFGGSLAPEGCDSRSYGVSPY